MTEWIVFPANISVCSAKKCAHCPKKSLLLWIKTDLVPAEADTTVYVWFLDQILYVETKAGHSLLHLLQRGFNVEIQIIFGTVWTHSLAGCIREQLLIKWGLSSDYIWDSVDTQFSLLYTWAASYQVRTSQSSLCSILTSTTWEGEEKKLWQNWNSLY